MTTPIALDDELIEGRCAELGAYTVAFERFPRDVDPSGSSWGSRTTGAAARTGE